MLLAITIVLSGLSSNMRAEVVRTVAATGADHWLVTAGNNGPLASVSVMPMTSVEDAAALAGVDVADPIVMLRQSMHVNDATGTEDVVLFGHVPGGLGTPEVIRGRASASPGEAVIDEWSGVQLGDVVTVGAGSFSIVGLTSRLTIAGGIAGMYAALPDVQAAVFGGAPLVQAVLLRGEPRSLPAEYGLLTPTDIVDDVMRPIQRMTYSLNLISFLLWAAAASVVGSIVYLTAVERTRDFAALRAIGVGRHTLLGGLAIQGVLATTIAAVISVGLAWLLMPLFPTPLSLTGESVVLLAPVTVLVGVLASGASVRRVLQIDPAVAFGGV